MGLPDGRTILFLFKELKEELPSSSHRAEVALFIAGKKKKLYWTAESTVVAFSVLSCPSVLVHNCFLTSNNRNLAIDIALLSGSSIPKERTSNNRYNPDKIIYVPSLADYFT